MARLEAEAKTDMGMPLDDAQKKSLEAEKTIGHIDTSGAEHDAMMKHLEQMLSSYDQRDAVLTHVKEMMKGRQLGEMAPEHTESAEKQMSALVNDFNRLQTEFTDLIHLIGDAAGIQKAELTD
jgi:exonuclease VII small subunit